MNISPELAAKVLDADLRNIVKKVSDGGILSPSERGMLQNAAFPESHAKSQRALALALKYSSGARLTAAELAEVREMHPGFAPEAVATPAPSEDSGASPSVPLKLSAEPPDSGVSRAQLDRWAECYGTQHRQLRRWIARGRERGEPCPLDNPVAMPAWIDKHLGKVRQDLRDKVQAAADAAQASAPKAEPTADAAAAPAPAAVPVAQVTPTIAPLDLGTVGGVEGESVEFFRRMFSAVKLQLEEAYKAGNEDRIRVLHGRLERTAESLRKHEIAAEARARRLGDLLEKAEVFNEITQALNTLRLMREHMSKRVLSEVPELSPELADRVRASIERVREREEALLRNLGALKTSQDVLFALAA